MMAMLTSKNSTLSIPSLDSPVIVTWSTLIGLVIAFSLFLFTPVWSVSVEEKSGAQWLTQGESLAQQGNFAEAVQSFTQATHQFEANGNSRQQGHALLRLAHALTQLGHYDHARLVLEVAIEFERKIGDVASTSLAMGQLGNVLLALGKKSEGLTLLRESLALARQENQPLLTAGILNDLGNALAAQHSYDEAFGAYTESHILAENEGGHSLAVRTLINSGFVALRQQSYSDAMERFHSARHQLQSVPDSHDKAHALLSIGKGYSDLLQHIPTQQNALAVQSAKTFRHAASLSVSLDDWRTESYGWGFLGQLYAQEGRWNEALELTRRALLASQRGHAPESLYRWEWQMGRILHKLGEQDKAILSYQRAIYTLQPIKREISFGLQEPTSFRQTIGPLFFELADLLLKQVEATPDQKEQQAILYRIRNTIEGFKAAELQDYFKDDCVEATQKRIQAIDKISKTTAIIYPIIFPTRIELLVSLGETIKRLTIQVSESEFTQSIRSFRRLLEKRTTRQYLPHAQSLYNLLIRPMEPLLEEFHIDTLVFVPDGPLRTIPMSSLHDGQRFLIESYAVATTPGLTLTDAEPINRKDIRLLSVGLTKPVHGFPSLPNVGDEIKELQVLYGGEVLLDEQFVIPQMEKIMKKEQFSIVHIASHGQFESKVENSFLLAFDGKITMNRLDELIGLFQFRDSPLDLLVLSACETAAGDDQAALGLAGVAIKAGARSALATLWFINDKASSDIVIAFYKELTSPNTSKAQALRHAQLELIAHPVYQHPSYWAPFLIINNWL